MAAVIQCLEGNRAHGPYSEHQSKTVRAFQHFFLLLALVFMVFVGYGIVLPVLPAYLESLLASAGRISVRHVLAGAVPVCAALGLRL